jgi:hypothetical protein
LLERSQVRIPLELYFCFFNLILARRGMHVGMGIAGRGNEKDSGSGNAGRGNGNGRTRNGSLPLTALISSRDYNCLIKLMVGYI